MGGVVSLICCLNVVGDARRPCGSERSGILAKAGDPGQYRISGIRPRNPPARRQSPSPAEDRQLARTNDGSGSGKRRTIERGRASGVRPAGHAAIGTEHAARMTGHPALVTGKAARAAGPEAPSSVWQWGSTQCQAQSTAKESRLTDAPATSTDAEAIFTIDVPLFTVLASIRTRHEPTISVPDAKKLIPDRITVSPETKQCIAETTMRNAAAKT